MTVVMSRRTAWIASEAGHLPESHPVAQTVVLTIVLVIVGVVAGLVLGLALVESLSLAGLGGLSLA
jgi:hypothetical protein